MLVQPVEGLFDQFIARDAVAGLVNQVLLLFLLRSSRVTAVIESLPLRQFLQVQPGDRGDRR